MAFNFKNAEDVEAYLKNIYMEYKFGCESEKNGNACHLLGDYHESITQEIEKAADIYKTNCDERDWPRSCAKFGSFKFLGKGCTKDMAEAFKYMKKGCDLNDGRGCFQGGILATARDAEVEEDKVAQIKKGMKMLEKACHELDVESGCFHLAGIHLGGLKEWIEPNLREAYKLSFKSCELGNPYACANLSQMHARGDGAQKNEQLAQTFKDRALILHKELVEVQKQLEFQKGIPT